MSQHANRFEQAVAGLRVDQANGVVRVQDGGTTWLCRARAWHAAQAQLERQRPIMPGPDGDPDTCGMEAYDALCNAVSAPIISVGGSDRGSEPERAKLARWADKGGLLPEALRSMVAER